MAETVAGVLANMALATLLQVEQAVRKTEVQEIPVAAEAAADLTKREAGRLLARMTLTEPAEEAATVRTTHPCSRGLELAEREQGSEIQGPAEFLMEVGAASHKRIKAPQDSRPQVLSGELAEVVVVRRVTALPLSLARTESRARFVSHTRRHRRLT